MSAAPNSVPAEEQFDWIQLSEALQDPNAETFTEKLWRKTKANPFVPIGKFHPKRKISIDDIFN